MAEQFTVPMKVGGNAVMFAPNPKADPHIEWSLRYGRDLNNPEAGRFSAAAIVESFAYLLSDNINMTEATRRLRVMRAAMRAHASGVPPSDGQTCPGIPASSALDSSAPTVNPAQSEARQDGQEAASDTVLQSDQQKGKKP